MRARSAAPVALKIDSPDIAHKTEAGAIRLGVEGDDRVRAAFSEVMSAARRYAPQAALNGVLVQAMAPKGVEMMLGVVSDPVFGPIVAVGLGGIYVEVLKDVAYRAAPVTRAAGGGACWASCAARSSSTACAGWRRGTRKR